MSELRGIQPEFINRVDDIVVFDTLSREEVAAILSIQVAELSSRLEEQNLDIVIKPAARKYLVDNGYEPAFGARPMRRLIQREIEDPLSLMIIAGKLASGDTVRVDARDGKLSLSVKKRATMRIEDDLAKKTDDEELDGVPAPGSGSAYTKHDNLVYSRPS
jgi:ATP-dependent Clp protease ATP-binding subunit ClpC